MDSWPSQLQQILNVDDFSYNPGSTAIRSEVDVGPAKVRNRATDAVDVITCQFNLPLADYSAFMLFGRTTLSNWVSQFLFDDPFTGDPTAYRFISPPKIVPLSGGIEFRVSMTWEKLP